ncbi:GGDEF domain-containing protein [Paenibacillus wulumuqiensis]|uniref:GGDEF domain-containing protein n=1 Tax=Paenibacillus wulumuqiensis TaxID=1567107 RepID=UPI000696B01D|nr:GGDEF domain-containing protein [Paenibacillus wulumuqiensis]
MNINLDMKTVFMSLVLGHIFTVILISAYRRSSVKDRAVNTFILAKWFQAVAWAMLIFRGILPGIFSIVLANTLLFTGAALETAALLILQQSYSRRVRIWHLLYTIVCIAGFAAIYMMNVSEGTRIIYASIGTALFLVYPVYRLTRDPHASSLKRLVGYLYGVVLISMLYRALATLQLGSQAGLFSVGLSQTVSFIALYLIMILGNVGFVLLSKEQADMDLLRMASYDEMTDVLNRRTFIVESRNTIHKLARQGKQVSFILFDIDAYKTINDTYGHFTGDRVLTDMTDRIRQCLSELTTEDYLFGRYGGDEFAVLLPDTDEQQAAACAEALRRAIADHPPDVLPIAYTISLGVVTVPATADIQMNTLYVLSDQALYQAKRAGRNQVAVHMLQPDRIETVHMSHK